MDKVDHFRFGFVWSFALALEMRVVYFFLLAFLALTQSEVLNFVSLGGIPNDNSLATEQNNGALLNKTFSSMLPGDVLLIPEGLNFYVMGGIKGENLVDITFQLDGNITFSDRIRHWPTYSNGNVLMCFEFTNVENMVFTSSQKLGVLDGQGSSWWGQPGVGYLRRGENRPRLLQINGGKNVLIENWFFLNSPYWTTWLNDMDGLEVRNSKIDARRDDFQGHSLYDLSAFNTDGFDVGGFNIYIHDSEVWNQDDCFCVKGNSGNITFENIKASGLGLTIGSIGGPNHVTNVTYRNAYMPYTVKGIYLKFRSDNAVIEDILYENIYMEAPSQYPIWIGPAQQSDSDELCAAHPCSICWPQNGDCNPTNSQYKNLTFRNITANNPAGSPGVIFGSSVYPMTNIIFEDVVMNNPGTNPFGADYFCEGVDKNTAIAKGKTWPVPACFTDETTN